MILQIGNGAVIPDCDNTTYIEMEYFRFKPSISDDVVKASIVISHAGKKFPELSCCSSYLSVSSYSEDGSRNSSKAVDYLKGGGVNCILLKNLSVLRCVSYLDFLRPGDKNNNKFSLFNFSLSKPSAWLHIGKYYRLRL